MTQVCENCGGRVRDFPCIHCWWDVGDELYCPHFMDPQVWKAGIEGRWKPLPKRKEPKVWDLPGITQPREIENE